MQADLLIIAGPSCVGKTPLLRACQASDPDMFSSGGMTVFHSRVPRKGEEDGVDYHFRSRDEILALEEKGILKAFQVRRDTIGVPFEELRRLNETRGIYEGNPVIASWLIQNKEGWGLRIKSVFISPFSREEIKEIKKDQSKDLELEVRNEMIGKQFQRAKKIFDGIDVDIKADLEVRASSAFKEMSYAHLFDHIIVNHDGEGSPNWDPIENPKGEAQKSVNSLKNIVHDLKDSSLETWEEDLIPIS